MFFLVDQALQYHLCFKSWLNQPSTVSFNIRIQKNAIHPAELVTTDHTERVENLVEKAMQKVDEISEQQDYAMSRESTHRNLAEATNTRVLWWTVFRASIVVVLAVVQMYYMRSFFEIKSIV
eukprot:GHVU01119190.1.p2 GENE.GHVU01119190.1~~GHVU01119190.1.p2  ORF type:complete len:122 (+),score=18.21 GHVU01119190.1:465-830(+)